MLANTYHYKMMMGGRKLVTNSQRKMVMESWSLMKVKDSGRRKAVVRGGQWPTSVAKKT